MPMYRSFEFGCDPSETKQCFEYMDSDYYSDAEVGYEEPTDSRDSSEYGLDDYDEDEDDDDQQGQESDDQDFA
jgi:hypothetical protein